MKNLFKDGLAGVLTNLAYIVGGISFPFSIAGLFTGMGVMSGVHHAVRSSFTQKLDYGAMYAIASGLIAVGLGVSPWFGLLGVLLIPLLGASRKALGALIAGVVGLLGYHVGSASVVHVMSLLGTAYGFNFLGEVVRKDATWNKHYPFFHGLWHLISAHTLVTAYNYLLNVV